MSVRTVSPTVNSDAEEQGRTPALVACVDGAANSSTKHAAAAAAAPDVVADGAVADDIDNVLDDKAAVDVVEDSGTAVCDSVQKLSCRH